jgi:hypothetical protein
LIPEIWQPTPGYCDQALKKDIDWAGMATQGRGAGTEWDHLVHAWTKGMSWSAWTEVRGRFADDVARHHYWSQPAIKAIREGQQTVPRERRRWDIDDAWSGPREDYVATAEANAGVTHAVVFNGECLLSDDHAGEAQWNKRFRAILDRVSGEATVTIVDCHA